MKTATNLVYAKAQDAEITSVTSAQISTKEHDKVGQECVVDSKPVSQAAYESLPVMLLAEEAEFYGEYSWCLNALPTFKEVVEHLSEELVRIERLQGGWQESEVLTNIFLVSCAVTDTVDDYLAGASYDFSRISRAFPSARPAVRGVEHLVAFAGWCRAASLFRLRRWRDLWAAAVTAFLKQTLVDRAERWTLLGERDRLVRLVRGPFPKALWRRHPRIPAFFRSRDFAPQDCLELGRKFLRAFPARERPVLVMGLRTAGSFLAPLLCAYLDSRLYDSQWVAVRPKQGLAPHERARLREAARKKARLLIIDESIHSGDTLAQTVVMLRQAGFADEDMVVLNPVEPAFPKWKDSKTFQSVAQVNLIALEPAERYKQQLMETEAAVLQIGEYFQARGYVKAEIVASPETEALNREWRKPPERVDIRLKRVYEVRLERADGASETRFVLAKSVGWGWFGYHAFVAAQQLAPFVPAVLGLRSGILYTEWLSNAENPAIANDREAMIGSLASYIAARVRGLRLGGDPARDLAREGRLKGYAILSEALSRACNSRLAAAVQRRRIQRELAKQGCPEPVLTDSKMSREEWLLSGTSLLKVDFEHHGQGKNELGMTDPAFDLAGAIYYFGLSAAESARLVSNYLHESDDVSVEQRLLMNKLLVGLWSQNLATLGLETPGLLHRRNESHRQYVASWNFLVAETLRECGKYCYCPDEVRWQSPLVAVDIDGVLDRMVFGYPSTTAAGIKAISLLHAHGFTVLANTARSHPEVKQYCRAYHFAGGVAEYGSAIWDGVSGREQVLVSQESQHQLAEVRAALQVIPGVFLNDDYRYSLRAFSYHNGRTIPLPRLLVEDLLGSVKADRLHAHHTGLDTAILARETDKGKGLLSLLALAGLQEREVMAIGDSEPDLAMFRVASSCFAPANISCAREATLLGCHIAASAYQPGLLEIACRIVHPNGGACDRCQAVATRWPKDGSLFVRLLELADAKPLPLILANLFTPDLAGIFRR
jgi:hydroxymethylpyrimidine pyrophosphatase-like HAD family hydrolase